MYLLIHAWRSVVRNRHRSLSMCVQLIIGLIVLTFTVGLWVGAFAPMFKVRSAGFENTVIGVALPMSVVPDEEEMVQIPGVDDCIFVRDSDGDHGLDVKPVTRIIVSKDYVTRFTYEVQTGRYLTHEDFYAPLDAVPVVVSRSLSKYYPVGATFKLSWKATAVVVGVLKETRKVWTRPPEMFVATRHFFIAPYNWEWFSYPFETSDTGPCSILIVPTEDANVYELIQTLKKRWPALMFYPMSYELQTNPKLDRPLRTWLSYIAFICLTVAAVGFGSSHFFTLRQRFREVGVQLAFGAKPRHFISQIMLEALILLTIPYVVSIVVGNVLGGILVDAIVFELYESGLTTHLIVLGISVFALWLSILPTAILVSRLTPAQLLRIR